MSERILKVDHPAMSGDDVSAWQKSVVEIFKRMHIHCPLKVDGVYGLHTRSYTAALCYASGLIAGEAMKNGVTPDLRSKLRHQKLNAGERYRKFLPKTVKYRTRLRKRWAPSFGRVHSPTTVIIEDSWGYHPGVHDGLDVITPPSPVIFAMVRSRVIDVRAAGWWNLGAPKDPKLKAKGDGIIQLEVLENVGPFHKGMHIGYGHAEKALVRVGSIVDAGHAIGHAGFANAWHIHLMVNNGSQGNRGVGTQDPRPLLDYARKHSYS